MKKITVILIVCFMLLFSVGCSDMVTSDKELVSESMFVKVEINREFTVVYHKDTKVMYVISMGAYNEGTFTLMVDIDGKPLLWQGGLLNGKE